MGLGTGTGTGLGTKTGTGMGFGTGTGFGIGLGTGMGIGLGTGIGFGTGLGIGFGIGLGIGTGTWVGTGFGTGTFVGADTIVICAEGGGELLAELIWLTNDFKATDKIPNLVLSPHALAVPSGLGRYRPASAHWKAPLLSK